MTSNDSDLIPLKPPGIYLAPGEQIPNDVLDQLKKINENYSRTKNFEVYRGELQRLFSLQKVQDREELKNYLGGFIEGEGSINVSAKKDHRTTLKLVLDPEFSVTQHLNGISTLFKILCIFKTGRISHKGGSAATMVYTIGARLSLSEKVIPFYENYVCPFGSPVKQRRFEIFKKMLELFDQGAHTNKDRMINELLPLWSEIRMQVGQVNQSFPNLESAQDYVRES